MKKLKIITLFTIISISVFSQIQRFDYTNSKIFKIKINGIDNIERGRFIDKILLNYDDIIFSSITNNDFITYIIVNEKFSFDKIETIIIGNKYTCNLINTYEFSNDLFEQIYTSTYFVKEINTKYGILKKYYTNSKIKDEINFSKYLEIIGSKK